MRSLRTWLALGLIAAIASTAAVGLGAWWVTAGWQAGRQQDRIDAATHLAETSPLDTAAERQALTEQLTRLGVEAQLSPDLKAAAPTEEQLRAMKLGAIDLITPGIKALQQGVDSKREVLNTYRTIDVAAPGLQGTLFIRRESAAVRWAVALGAGAVALALVLAFAVSLLRRWVLLPLARLADGAERIAGGELTIEPVTSRAREVAQVGEAMRGMAAALDGALGTATAAERDRRFLISAIAHDLRTPLFTLRGSLEAIERGIGDDMSLTRAQTKAAHIDRLVGDLFAFSRAEYTNEAQPTEPVDLSEIARRAADTVDPGPLRLDVVTNGPVRLEGDPVALQRVLTNLLDNALHHARSRVELRVTGPRVDVTDDGPGFAADDLPHVFEPLYRGDKARGAGGAGLGLAIARRLVRAHGGDVAAMNLPAGGARVTVTLA